ncbi:hypothetical protein WJX75_005282 [Coccomyxa subellipsoidea]|uniref:Uncharacterized protein n=1 Tax=Coccomyxa subellipsoidea TaxID=248742 RepID=A0ABR2YJM1_9CHLO
MSCSDNFNRTSMQDLAQLITFVEACIPDIDISVLEKALIIHYEYMDATLSRASLSQTTYDTALQDLRSRLPRDETEWQHVGMVVAAVPGRICLGDFPPGASYL